MRLKLVLPLVLLVAVSAAAQNNRSFVATYGNDANNCTAGNECRTFSRALGVTNAGGEVIALTSGGYGPFLVSQSVSVIAATGAASITSSGGISGVTIAAGASDRVVLEGLRVTMTDTTSYGIYATSYGSLTLEHCTVAGGAVGLYLAGDGNSAATIADTTIRGANQNGFDLHASAALSGCRAEKNANVGLLVEEFSSNVSVEAKDLVSNGNGSGVLAFGATSGSGVLVALDHALITNNTGTGVGCSSAAGSFAFVDITSSTVVRNAGFGLASSNNSIYSTGNNMVSGNIGGDTFGVINALTMH